MNRPHVLARVLAALGAGVTLALATPALSATSHSSTPGCESQPVGGHSHPVGCCSEPVGHHSGPVGDGSPPVGCCSEPVGHHSGPVGEGSPPVGCHSEPGGAPDVGVTASARDTRVGTTGTLRVRLRNVGGAATTGSLRFNITPGSGWIPLVVVPDGHTACTAGSFGLSCTRAGTLAPREAAVVSFTFRPEESDVPGQFVAVHAVTPGDSNPANDAAGVRLVVLNRLRPDLSLTMTAVRQAPRMYAFTIGAQNLGDGFGYHGAVVTFHLPRGFALQTSYSGEWMCGMFYGLASNQCSTFRTVAPHSDLGTGTIVFRAPAGWRGPATISAIVTPDYDVNPANNVAFATIR